MADSDLPEPKSKSQLKRDSEDLKELGEVLIKMSAAERSQVPLTEPIEAAIELAQRITSHGALRRQVQYLGKLLREIDAEPIRAAVDAIRQTGLQSAAHFQRLERWRDRLIAEGDTAITEFIAAYPAADRNQLRQLVRAANKEMNEAAPPKSSRALFRFLRDASARSATEEE